MQEVLKVPDPLTEGPNYNVNQVPFNGVWCIIWCLKLSSCHAADGTGSVGPPGSMLSFTITHIATPIFFPIFFMSRCAQGARGGNEVVYHLWPVGDRDKVLGGTPAAQTCLLCKRCARYCIEMGRQQQGVRWFGGVVDAASSVHGPGWVT